MRGRLYAVSRGWVLGWVAFAAVPMALAAGCGPETHTESTREATVSEQETMTEKATFAAGCFWGVEAAFRQLDGVVSTQVGYTGGTTESPTYKRVCSGKTGHAEAVEVTYDPSRIAYEDLLEAFWKAHDPTQLNRQGWDVGSQYRSGIFYHSEQQAEVARASKAALEGSGAFKRPIATEIQAAGPFYRAEEYHQQYYEKRGGGACPTR